MSLHPPEYIRIDKRDRDDFLHILKDIYAFLCERELEQEFEKYRLKQKRKKKQYNRGSDVQP